MAEVLSPITPAKSPELDSPRRSHLSRDTLPPAMSGQSQYSNQANIPRNAYGQTSNNSTGYRGTAAAPTYAFSSTPQLRPSSRSASANNAASNNSDAHLSVNRQRYPAPNGSVSTTSSSASSAASWSQTLFSKDDSVLNSAFSLQPFTTANAPQLDTSLTSKLTDSPLKPSPNRYHRPGRKSESNIALTKPPPQATEQVTNLSDGAESAAINEKESNTAEEAVETPPANEETAEMHQQAKTETNAPTSPLGDFPSLQQAVGATSRSRYKRRTQSGTSSTQPQIEAPTSGATLQNSPTLDRPASSSGSRPALSNTNRGDSANGPARTFADVARRTNGPSPLSRPPVQSNGPPSPEAPRTTYTGNPAFQNSPAVAAMAALSEKASDRRMTSKFRRAFSFGSSAEIRRAGDSDAAAAERAKLRKEQFSNELDEEQEAIAKQQTAAGLGNNIYSGQAGFTGSTDNISISSTASSASLMLRKMGRGMKKGGRSLKGLFRPKSVVDVPPPDAPVTSFVHVEAERDRVNVSAHAKDNGGGTGFPRLDRNSIDAARMSISADHEGPDNRKSILGGETDRQEVLAAVRRGILKRTGTGSSTNSISNNATIVDGGDRSPIHPPQMGLDRRGSPVSSSHSADSKSHGRTESTTMYNSDGFFAGVPTRHPNDSSKSLPGNTNRLGSKSITFSSRLQFYDVWSAMDYDRRGDVATCNRLTPMLAQQIKEELNTFKMEMPVHEQSKAYTHFF